MERIDAEADLIITVHAVGHRRGVPCPLCGTSSARVANLPWPGVRVRLVTTVRRFFCCAKRLPLTAERYTRRTPRAARYERVVALTAAGLSVGCIAAVTGLHPHTGRWWIRAGRFPECKPLARRRWRSLDEQTAYVVKHYDGGLEKAVVLCAELRALEFARLLRKCDPNALRP